METTEKGCDIYRQHSVQDYTTTLLKMDTNSLLQENKQIMSRCTHMHESSEVSVQALSTMYINMMCHVCKKRPVRTKYRVGPRLSVSERPTQYVVMEEQVLESPGVTRL